MSAPEFSIAASITGGELTLVVKLDRIAWIDAAPQEDRLSIFTRQGRTIVVPCPDEPAELFQAFAAWQEAERRS